MAASALHALLTAAQARLLEERRQILALQRRIAAIPSPTGAERARADFVRATLIAGGLRDTVLDRAGNVVARRPGTEARPPVAVCAHIDTVFSALETISVRERGTRLEAPGITDNARGVAAMLAVARTLDALGVRTRHPIDFVGTVCEEGAGDLRGAKRYFADRLGDGAPVAAIALDGAGDERVVHRAVGSRRFRITYRGRGGHSWTDHGMPNAVHAAARCGAALAVLPLPREPRTTLTVAQIAGGFAINSIPAVAALEVDIRSTDPVTIGHLEGELRAIARRAGAAENGEFRSGDGALAIEILRIGNRPCGETPPAEPLVRDAVDITRAVGREPEPAESSTDASAAIGCGIPAIAIGAGGRGGATHTLDEWYEDVDGARGLARATAIIASAAGLG